MTRDSLFQSEIVPGKPGSGRLFDEKLTAHAGPVTCLGMTFTNDGERRTWFTEKLREKLKDPEFRKIEGFPLGSDEDILALSDPPYYTACQNPWAVDFVKAWEAEKPARNTPYHREPFATDVSEGKTHPVYKAHGYHTKVPHLAIVPSILHYTEAGDIILDGFSGSGQTGVAAQWCGAAPASYRAELENRWKAEGRSAPNWGARHCVLNDLSPTASFISSNYNQPFDGKAFEDAARKLLRDVEQELGWMYETLHSDGKTKGRIEYMVWSEVFTCPNCAGDVIFVEEALDEDTKRVHESFPCPHCHATLSKRSLQKSFETVFDSATGSTLQRPKRVPSLIFYKVSGTRYEKKPDQADLDVLKKIETLHLPDCLPKAALPYMHMTHERARMDKSGITHIHHFFLPRAAQALGAVWQRAKAHPDARIRHMLMFTAEQAIWGMSILARYAPTHFSQVNQYLNGVYYVGAQIAECSPWYVLDGKVSRLPKAFELSYAHAAGTVVATCSTTTHLCLPDTSIDYIFTDPPFGENIYYADLNFLVESWYGVLSNAKAEAIVDQAKNKALTDYQELMRRCFAEYYRVLKPGRWITIVFHNSRNAVWNAIQEALQAAGFVVADVRTLDKKQGSYRQVTSTAAKQDLVISAYKANGGLEERFQLSAGTEQGVWDFVNTHLNNLPIFDQLSNRGKTIAERTDFRLYDRMVSFHVLRGVTIPLSASEFYAGLAQRYSARDGMYFLPEQVVEYDKRRLTVEEVDAPELFILDEATAREWLREFLKRRPSTFQELHPQFIREIGGWQKHEKPLELSELLQQSFLCYDGAGPVREQIHAYLSSNWKELRNLSKDDPGLRAKARDRWYVPDPNKAGDLEKLRDKALLKEFEAYKKEKKKLKVFRLEAVRAGFKKAWADRDYATIVAVADKIPSSVLEEDPKLLMWYDQATTRIGGDA